MDNKWKDGGCKENANIIGFTTRTYFMMNVKHAFYMNIRTIIYKNEQI